MPKVNTQGILPDNPVAILLMLDQACPSTPSPVQDDKTHLSRNPSAFAQVTIPCRKSSLWRERIDSSRPWKEELRKGEGEEGVPGRKKWRDRCKLRGRRAGGDGEIAVRAERPPWPRRWRLLACFLGNLKTWVTEIAREAAIRASSFSCKQPVK